MKRYSRHRGERNELVRYKAGHLGRRSTRSSGKRTLRLIDGGTVTRIRNREVYLHFKELAIYVTEWCGAQI